MSLSLPFSFTFPSSCSFPLCFLSVSLPFIPSHFSSLTLGGVTIDKADPSTVEALVGQTVVLPCRVSPPPSSTIIVEWRRDGIPLSSHRSVEEHTLGGLNHPNQVIFLSLFLIIIHLFYYIFFRHHQQPNGSLLVGPITKSDSGWFLCVATRERERDHRYIYLSVSGNYLHKYISVRNTKLKTDWTLLYLKTSDAKTASNNKKYSMLFIMYISMHSYGISTHVKWVHDGTSARMNVKLGSCIQFHQFNSNKFVFCSKIHFVHFFWTWQRKRFQRHKKCNWKHYKGWNQKSK